MPKLPRALKDLDDDLAALSSETMMLSELDGFIAGLLICPELIPPREWLKYVWGEDEDGTEVAFESVEQMNRILAGVMGHYNSVAKRLLDPEADYEPIYDVDSRTSDVYWQMWADGFVRAVDLRPDAWSVLLQQGDDYSASLIVLMTLGALGDVIGPVEDEEAKELIANAPEVIPELVSALNDWRIQNERLSTRLRPAKKVGRNDPCPCGSGTKYKKCCGAS